MALLENKIIIVTGAGAGIGQGSAEVLAREGATVIVSDINLASAEETVQRITAKGGTAIAVKTDVSDKTEVEALIQLAIDKYGRLDGAFNNAGIPGPTTPMGEYADEDFDKVIATNLKSVWLCMKAQINVMLKQAGGGAIVNTASVGGIVGKPGISAYIAAKHGVVGLTKTAALEYGSQGIRINAVCPGVIRTAMVDYMINSGNMGTEADWNGLQPIGRMGTPEEIGEYVAWALSDRASLLHGQSIALDGGFTVS
ncbi:glucose 1-dehydrogenase [Fluviicola sp.]|uniref:SDR family NAD(P)-dependent oxidoreductase n=1 Tax=Fluviicola sp. TaxID=1917219 RepID=UPI0031D6A62F